MSFKDGSVLVDLSGLDLGLEVDVLMEY